MNSIEHVSAVDAQQHLMRIIHKVRHGGLVVIERSTDRSSTAMLPFDAYADVVARVEVQPVEVERLGDKVTLFSSDLNLFADGVTLHHASQRFFDKLDKLVDSYVNGDTDIERDARPVLRRVQLAGGDRAALAEMFAIPAQ